MRAISRFSLEEHPGDYDTWPVRTRLLADGTPTSLKLSGYDLRWQFELDGGFLLITDYDCPYEEAYEIYLLSAQLRMRSHHSDPSPGTVALGAFASVAASSRNLYCGAEIVNSRSVRLLGCEKPPHLQITVLQKRPLGIGRLLRVDSVA
jgi:hypothetical protein